MVFVHGHLLQAGTGKQICFHSSDISMLDSLSPEALLYMESLELPFPGAAISHIFVSTDQISLDMAHLLKKKFAADIGLSGTIEIVPMPLLYCMAPDNSCELLGEAIYKIKKHKAFSDKRSVIVQSDIVKMTAFVQKFYKNHSFEDVPFTTNSIGFWMKNNQTIQHF